LEETKAHVGERREWEGRAIREAVRVERDNAIACRRRCSQGVLRYGRATCNAGRHQRPYTCSCQFVGATGLVGSMCVNFYLLTSYN